MSDESPPNSPKFDFITDPNFRTSLESDYRELCRCLESGAWKAVHVLAGSVVEAVLTDYLIGIGYQNQSRKDLLKMELADIISACRDKKIIAERTADLSSVIRSYRNLIHPGRVIRLNEKVDQKSASISKALVDVVADEVAAAKTATYGFTAEQIANKVEKDPSAVALLTHFLRETNDRERERLVLDVLPSRLFFAQELGDETSSGDYVKCHRQTLETLSDEAKAKVARRFVKVLKEESGGYVLAYENAFFRAGDLKFLSANDAAMAKAHLLARLEKELTVGLLQVVEDLGRFLEAGEVTRVADAYVRAIAYGKLPIIKQRGNYLLDMLFSEVEGDIQTKLEGRVDTWISFLGEKGLTEAKAVLEEIRSGWSGEVPF